MTLALTLGHLSAPGISYLYNLVFNACVVALLTWCHALNHRALHGWLQNDRLKTPKSNERHDHFNLN